MELSDAFCEFYGVLLGDGCLSRYKIQGKYIRRTIGITGDSLVDKKYYTEYLLKLMNNLGLNPYVRFRKSCRVIAVFISNKSFFEFLESLGFPIGKKKDRLKIPNRLLELPWNKKKLIIRGVFDTDGCIFAKKHENYRYPHIAIASATPSFLNQLNLMLKEQGYVCYINGKDLRVRGIRNVKKWMEDIGTSNPKHAHKYEYWLSNGYLPARLGPVV